MDLDGLPSGGGAARIYVEKMASPAPNLALAQANPSSPTGVVGVTQSTDSRCINGGIGD